MATRGATLIAASMVAASAVGAVALISSAASGHPLSVDTSLAAVAPAVVDPAAAPAEPKTTLHLPTTLHLMSTTTGAQQLDSTHVVFSAGVTHTNARKIIGTASYTCLATTSGALRQTCRGALALRDGILLVNESLVIATGKITGQVVGGSGSYKGARGTVTGTSVSGGKSKLTIHYSLG